jgi:YfiR/HmsC-like
LVPFALLLGGTTVDAQMASAKEHELKAAYIYNFAKFARWSSAGATGVPNPLVIGVLGDPRVALSLTALTRNHTISGSVIEVRVLEPGSVSSDVRIAYIAASQDDAIREHAPQLFVPNRLTVGESELFRDSGGIIRLVVQGERLQFEIDNSRAQKSGITLSSQLLMLARQVF